MNFSKASTRIPLALIAGACQLLAGCGGGGTTESVPGESRLIVVASIYDRLVTTKRGQAPKDEAEFKAFLADPMAKTILEQNKITDAESVFVSPRDNKPYVIMYGANYDKYQTENGAVFAYEQDGVNGSRIVAFRGGTLEEMPEDRFRKIVPAK